MTKVNEQIRVPNVRVIENETMIGVMDTREAIQRARSTNQDLIEVDGKANPPVCKIMDYGKFKYQQKKNEVKAPKVEQKEIRLRPQTDTHDLETKKRKIAEFLSEGHRVKLVMVFSGREMVYKAQGQAKMMAMIEELKAKIDGKIHSEGNKIFINLIKS